jgi:hypothetical protein
MHQYHAAPWSPSYNDCVRRTQHKRTKQHVHGHGTRFWTVKDPGCGRKYRVSPVRIQSPVCSIPTPRICQARMGIQPGRMVPVQRSWSPVHLLGPGYPAPALRTVSPMHQVSSAPPESSKSCATSRPGLWKRTGDLVRGTSTGGCGACLQPGATCTAL